MAITEKRHKPIGMLIASVSHHEVRLVEATLNACFVSVSPAILIGDKASDSDLLGDRGIDMIAPHKTTSERAQWHKLTVLRRT